ncbi:MAG: prepilin-type N-terminal cleavage/methylation domain-containing protein [Pseudomonadota bacterium]
MPHHHTCRRTQSGYSLLELLVTLGIITAVAGVGVQVYNGLNEDVDDRLVLRELSEMASAVRRFRVDTGYWPKEGVFAGAEDDNLAHPANLAQLFTEPLNADDDPLFGYDPATGTGWNGPYIAEFVNVTVDIYNLDADAGDDDDPEIDPGVTPTPVIVRGVGDPFDAPPAATGAYLWRLVDGDANRANDETRILGRPILYFIDAGAPANTACLSVPCLLSFGEDGVFNTADDIAVSLGEN